MCLKATTLPVPRSHSISNHRSSASDKRSDKICRSQVSFRLEPPKMLVFLSSLHVFGIKCIKDSLMTPRTKFLKIMSRGSEVFHVRRRRTTTTTVSQYTSNINDLQVSMYCANCSRTPQSPIANFQASIDEEGPGIVVRGRNGQQIHTHPGVATVIFSLKVLVHTKISSYLLRLVD